MWLAFLYMILKNVIYGTSVFFTGSLSESVDVLDILALRFLMSFAVFFLLKQTRILKINVGIRDVFQKTERHPYVKHLLLAAVFEPVLYMLFETLGITMSSGVTVAVILSLSPISACICEELILKEKSSLLQKVFLGCGIFGAIYIAVNTGSAEGHNTVIGILFLTLAVFSGSLFMVFSRKSSSHFSAFEVTYFSVLLGTIAFNAINVVRHLVRGDILAYFAPYANVNNLVGFVFLAVVSTIVATAMNNYAVSKMQVSTAAAFSGISTLVTVIIDVLCGSRLYLYHFIGFAFILIRMIGVSYLSIHKEKRLTTPHV